MAFVTQETRRPEGFVKPENYFGSVAGQCASLVLGKRGYFVVGLGQPARLTA